MDTDTERALDLARGLLARTTVRADHVTLTEIVLRLERVVGNGC